jgi:hypothetical protein
MPGVCIHEFFWPLRAADGRYYQVCRRCGAQCEYDWTNMDRVEGGPERTQSGPSGSKVSCNPDAGSRLRLLVELEPAHRVFLDNLADALRPTQPDANGRSAAPFWREVFFNSDIPWQRFAESMVCHMVALAVILLLSRMWSSDEFPRQRSMFENSHLTYYKPTGSFPALRGNRPRPRAVYRKPAESASRGSIQVAPERAQAAAMKAPDIKLKSVAPPVMAASNRVPPMMPLGSIQSSRLLAQTNRGPASPNSVVAPAPEVSQATSRRLGLPQASGVAPAPEPGVFSSKRVMSVPGTAIIAPPPVLQASIHTLGDMNIGPTTVVAPSPRLPVGEQRTIPVGPQSILGSTEALAVPPAPSAPRSGTLADGRGGFLTGGGPRVVPPPPSVQDVGGSVGGGHLSASSNSMPGSSLSGGGVQVVPPAPSLQDAGNSGAGRSGNSLSSAGPGSGLQGVPPAPSLGSGGNADHGGREVAMNAAPNLAPAPPPVTDNPQQKAERPREPDTEEMPLRLIGLAMALPSSSYFSNYEVYIAERRLRKNLTELVKLVYVYLPYQRRLSEYGVDNSKVYKLLVSRDRTCDESLMQMTWPENDPHPDVQNAADSPALSAEDKKSMLPCYRTTADDYRKAMSRR